MAYRIEYSDNNRAKCNGPTCAKEGNKILKGEIRLGTFVDTGQFSSFRWRHWRDGCTTDQVLANIKKKLDGVVDNLDGLENLNEHDQKVIKEAIERGSIDEAGPKPKSPKKSTSKKTEGENEEKEHENGVDGEEKPVVRKRKAPVAENGELHSPAKKRGKKADDKKSDVEEAAKPSRKRKAGTDESTHSKESSPTKLKFPVKEKSPAKEKSPSKEKSHSKETPPTKGDVLIPESPTEEVVAENADEVIADAEIIASDDSPVKKGRGRPKKEKSATEATTEDGEKRGRGRPKKEKSEVEPTENGEKRARGRPKKEKSGATSDDNDTAVKKGSGRPKDGDEAIKKGRGRPKKDVVA